MLSFRIFVHTQSWNFCENTRWWIAFKHYIVHKYCICVNKSPENVQICHLLYNCMQNRRFSCIVNWKCVQVSGWNNICVLNRVGNCMANLKSVGQIIRPKTMHKYGICVNKYPKRIKYFVYIAIVYTFFDSAVKSHVLHTFVN